ncbi:hypothetical protein GGR54DRAFT_135689 [Hypoxylon sp. NC1633]|nr:hypothetical protein GGR54DRAFT_135689 [Hypoxylon sp. NC1633]
MLSQTALALLGLASTAVATYSPRALKNVHDLRAEHVVVEVRQALESSTPTSTSSADSLECTTSALSLITDAPTPDAKLMSYFMNFATTANLENSSVLCQITQVPQSISADYSSYDQAVSSWVNKHSSDFVALASKCGGGEQAASVSQVVSALNDYVAAGCSSSAGGSSPTQSAAGQSGSGQSAAGQSSSTHSVSSGLAARPTGIVAGAVAAAGVLGFAAAL